MAVAAATCTGRTHCRADAAFGQTGRPAKVQTTLPDCPFARGRRGAGLMATYCPQCGTKLEEQFIFGRTRAVCPGCSYVHFEDPKVAVGVVVEKEGRIVLAKRGHEPNYGVWSFPSGFADAGEVLEDAARREVEEETGLSVRIDRLLGVYSRAGERTIFVAYAGTAIGGELAGGEAGPGGAPGAREPTPTPTPAATAPPAPTPTPAPAPEGPPQPPRDARPFPPELRAQVQPLLDRPAEIHGSPPRGEGAMSLVGRAHAPPRP